MECSCAIVAAKGMWYQVVSPPNMPRSRFSCEGKVHSATVKEATASARISAHLATAGGFTSSPRAGAIR